MNIFSPHPLWGTRTPAPTTMRQGSPSPFGGSGTVTWAVNPFSPQPAIPWSGLYPTPSPTPPGGTVGGPHLPSPDNSGSLWSAISPHPLGSGNPANSSIFGGGLQHLLGQGMARGGGVPGAIGTPQPFQPSLGGPQLATPSLASPLGGTNPLYQTRQPEPDFYNFDLFGGT